MQAFKNVVKLNSNKNQVIKSQLNFEGVNYELSPIVYMTTPKEWKSKLLLKAPVNEIIFNSVILLFKFIPIDIHRLYLAEIFGNGFKETSSSILMKYWNHNRTIENYEQGSILTDEISFKTRIPLLDIILKPIYINVFKHRHKKLKLKFG